MNTLCATFAEEPAKALREYRNTGFYIEPAIFSPEFCDELIAIANDFPAVKAGDFRTALQPHRQAGAFLKALRHPRVAEILAQILGGKVSGLQTQFFYGKPETPGFHPHQDSRYVNAAPGKFVSVWVALTDVSRENGGLYIYPGSFREALLETEEVPAPETNLQDMNALRSRCIVPERYKPVDLAVKKGGAVFFDGHAVHGSHTNRSNKHRYALLMTYIARGASFDPGRFAHREEVYLD
jgi:ectoine hydroxylase-related dioxygenase (phytanoyl-CoA dioxygenase family)